MAAAILPRAFMTLPGIPPPTTPTTTAVAFVVGQELAAVVLDEMHGVGGFRLPQALDLDVVLVAPSRDDDHDRRHVLPQHGGHHNPGLIGDIAPMFHAHLVSRRVTPGRDVAERPHVRRAGASGLVADHPVVDLDAAAGQPFGRRA